MTDQGLADYQDIMRQLSRRRFNVSGSGLLIAIVGFSVTAFIWAAAAKVDEVTKGQGKVVPSQKTQVIQSYEGGIIQNILVKEGDTVTKGQVLLELDQTLRRSEYEQTEQQYYGHLATTYRLKAEMSGGPLVFPEDLKIKAPNVVASESMLYESRRDGLAAEIKVLDSQLFQRKQELAEAKITLSTSQRGLSLANDELLIIQPLVERGLEPRLSLLQLQRTMSELEGKSGSAQLAVERLTSAIREIEEKRSGTVDHYRAAALGELSASTSKVGELSAAVTGVRDRLDRTALRAPVTGVVNRLYVKNVGVVAQPGMQLAEVVPSEDSVRVEGYIKPADIAFLRPGQHVKVKLTAYDYSRYGALDGTLETIGADSVEMPNHETMFPIQIETTGRLLDASGKPLDVRAGMVAEVDVLTGKKTVLDYLIRPVIKIKAQAFRE